ncbi:MAG TPA: diaminopimelate epimerase [Actinomycetota bacterium]|nr:diaminopimelate epimerase [Actinomycetota bacterium]
MGEGAEPIRFWKYHGTGNDFVLLEDLEDARPLDAALVARICDRRFGVGADGVIRVTRAEGADLAMDYRNADGSLAEMCGNGIRCLGKLAYDRGLTRRTELDVATRAGLRHLSLEVREGEVRAVTVDMGRPAFDRAEIPMAGPPTEPFLRQPVEVGGEPVPGSAVSMGNPHLVLLADRDPAEIDVASVGPLLERDPRFPEGTNVEFVRVDGGALRVRVWERGVGETMACGTGACAALVAAAEAGLVDRRAEVRFPGGTLVVSWEEDGRVLLTGPAVRVFEGVLDPAWVAAGS